MYQEYPKWLYCATAPACIVNSADEERALGAGWFVSPKDLLLPDDSGAQSLVDVETKKRGRPRKVE